MKINKYKNSIEEFLHSDNGQRFFNIAYSVGAAIVIWGALFKILHLPGGNTLLCIGMGTEIAMFLLTAFDRPPKEPNWDEIMPALTGQSPQQLSELTIVDDEGNPEGPSLNQNAPGATGGNAMVMGGNTVVMGGGYGLPVDPANVEAMADDFNQASDQLHKASELAEATNRFMEAIEGISQQMSEMNEKMASGSNGYAEHMADLNRNLAGLNTIYEIQLKSVSGQLEAIDRVNRGLKDIRDMYEKSASDSAKYCEETEKMTQYLRQINEVYARMITALTINQAMPMGSMMQAPQSPAPQTQAHAENPQNPIP